MKYSTILLVTILLALFLCPTKSIVASNINSYYSIDSFGNHNLNNLNWNIDSNLNLIIKNDFKCDGDNIYKSSGEISLSLKDKRDSTISHFVLKNVIIGETSLAIYDYIVIDMGVKKPMVIIIKISYNDGIDLDVFGFARLFKLECKDGRLTETEI